MALLQAVNSEASMAAGGDDLMEFSTEAQSPMAADDQIEVDIKEGTGAAASLPDQDMGDGGGGGGDNDLIDDDMADGDAATAAAPATGGNIPTDNTEHNEASSKPLTDPAVSNEPPASKPANADNQEEEGDDQGAEDDGDSDDNSPVPPQRRPAGKGPVGRAPQKTPAFSTAAKDDAPETTSHDSGEDSQDEENEPSGANPTTTEPSFTESAKNDSESDDESEAEPAPPAAKQPTYRESISDSDSESLVDHGPVHSIIVDYQGSKISLFPPQPDHEEQESYLLQDESLCHESVARMLSECRNVLHETLLEDEELVLTIPCLGMSISEQIAETMATTMTELVDLFLQLSYNDGVESPAALRVTLDTKEKCHARIELIRRMIGDGKGLSDVLAHLHDGVPAAPTSAAQKKPVIDNDFGAGTEELSQVGDQVDLPGSTTDPFVPSEPQDFEDQFNVETPGADDTDPLGTAGGENEADFLDFTSPEKQGKAGVDKGLSNFDDVFDGNFGPADNLMPAPDGSAGGPTLPGPQGGLDDFGGELGGGEFNVDTFDATNESKAGASASVALTTAPGTGGDWIQNPNDDFDPQSGAAQAAEDAFTFIDHAPEGEETLGVGDPDGGIGLLDVGTGSPTGIKRARPEEDGAGVLLEGGDVASKRARAE